jgi:hypothetical protein
VDNFGIKYFSKDDADHLLNALRTQYTISTNWNGNNYCGLTLHWHYNLGYVDISIPGYVFKALARLQHPKPFQPQYVPHCWTQPAYGQKVQLAPIDMTSELDKKGIKYIQSTIRLLMYFSRAVDPTMAPAINNIATEQSTASEDTLAKCKMLLDYAATCPEAIIHYFASDMVLAH